jgi:hypothetical protein
MGYAIARVAQRRGATVTLVSGPVALPPPPGVRVVAVESAADMQRALRDEFARATVLVMAAAVADYRPATPLARKLKKSAAAHRLALVRNPDILSGLAREKQGRTVVGFAAETHDLVAEARRKLREKHLDLIVANDVTAEGAGLGDHNVVRPSTRPADTALPVLPRTRSPPGSSTGSPRNGGAPAERGYGRMGGRGSRPRSRRASPFRGRAQHPGATGSPGRSPRVPIRSACWQALSWPFRAGPGWRSRRGR